MRWVSGMRAQTVELAKRWLTNKGGNVAIVFSLALLPMAAAGGGALDLARAENVRDRMQQAADTGALEAMVLRRQTDAVRVQSATDLTRNNLADFNDLTDFSIAVSVSSTDATVDISTAIPTNFLGLVGINTIEPEVTATARVTPGDVLPICVLALNLTEDRGIEASGGSSFYAENCIVHVNSNNDEAVNFSGGGSLNSGENCFVGGVKQGLERMTPAPTPDCAVIEDPFYSHYRPVVGPCDHDEEVRVSGHETFDLYPGTYCGGLNVSSADNVIFHPGVYVIVGEFRSTGGSRMEGEEVSFFLTGEDAGLEWSGGGEYYFTAPQDGPMRSMLVMLDPDEPNIGDRSHLSGGAGTYYEGNIYLPNQHLTVSGGGITSNPSPYTALVADTFTYSGGSTLLVTVDPNASETPVSRELYASANQRIVLVN
ncbi:TadE/TadG family type IV pilus assembly protein [Hyphobacterium sp. HN65]|uniref:TadE/TadG family type IV pilus assembly protein n=1 Tax=Hyphobacterium lacteum TaxID=3116575 RepID=A0ABU7LQ42_9PROT|nr:TadE/TadG family type IV pilus assembly protein [Hyphobacterium sp. HN65]MEE2526023.1 TadE/TadG family type IV pilus assembly protein [Hyphobacterium sp. HN65]